MTKETNDGRIEEFLDNHPLMTIVLMTLIVFLAGLSMATDMPSIEEPSIELTEFSSEYSEKSVSFTYEAGGKIVELENLNLYIDGYNVRFEKLDDKFQDTITPGYKLNYVHGSEWDGEEVRLVWKPDTPDEEVLYEGTAPEK